MLIYRITDSCSVQSPILHREKLSIHNWECEARLKVGTRRPRITDQPDKGGPFISPIGRRTYILVLLILV